MKICNKCKKEKEDDAFSPAQKKNWKGLSPYCKECKRLYDKEFWEKHKTRLNIKKQINKNLICDRNMKIVAEYLKKNPCIDCGETNIVVLEFDHFGDNKTSSICQLVCDGVSVNNLELEIKKCLVRCANCHRLKTAKERNYRILKFLN